MARLVQRLKGIKGVLPHFQTQHAANISRGGPQARETEQVGDQDHVGEDRAPIIQHPDEVFTRHAGDGNQRMPDFQGFRKGACLREPAVNRHSFTITLLLIIVIEASQRLKADLGVFVQTLDQHCGGLSRAQNDNRHSPPTPFRKERAGGGAGERHGCCCEASAKDQQAGIRPWVLQEKQGCRQGQAHKVDPEHRAPQFFHCAEPSSGVKSQCCVGQDKQSQQLPETEKIGKSDGGMEPMPDRHRQGASREDSEKVGS
jgi:hypothetical protein